MTFSEKDVLKSDRFSEKDKQEILDLREKLEGLSEYQRRIACYRKLNAIIDEYLLHENDIDSKKRDILLKDESLKMMVATQSPLSLYDSVMFPRIKARIQENKNVYKEVLVDYDEFLCKYANLAKELGINNSLDLATYFSYLLWNGYFSVNGKHFYNMDDRLLIHGLFSFDVIKGGGVCLNYSELMNDFYKKMDKESAMLICTAPTRTKEIKISYEQPIQTNHKKSKNKKKLIILSKSIIKDFGNHAVVLLKDEEGMGIYDPTNLLLLNIENINTAKLENGEGTFKINPVATLKLMPYCDQNNLFEQLESKDMQGIWYSEEKFIASTRKVLNIMKSNVPLIKDCYNDVYGNLINISNSIDIIGNPSKIKKKKR